MRASRATMGEYVPRLVPGPARCATTSSRSRSPSPRASSFTLDGNLLRWQRWSMRLGFNHREGLVLHTRRLRGRRPRAPDRAPAVVRRDGRALPRPDARPLPPHRVRHRRVGPGLHDHLARARLRLPRRDPLPRRRRCTTPTASRYTIRNAICIHEEDNAVLWKHVDARRRRRGAPHRAGWWSPSTSPSPTTSTSSTGASTRTATSSARCARPGSWSPRSFPEGEQPPYGTLVDERTYAPFHQHFLVARLDLDVDGERQHRLRDRVRGAARSAPTTRTASRWCSAATPLRTEAGGQAGLRLGHAARAGRSSTSNVRNGLGTPVGYKLVPGGCVPADDRPGLAGVPARAGDRPHAVGDPVRTRTSAGRAASSSIQSEEDRGLPVWTRAEPADREHRRRALVRLRHPPHHPAGGLAGDAGRHGLVLAQAVRLLRPQPGARRAADATATATT